MSRKKFTEAQKERLRKEAFRFGENLMEHDCAVIIGKHFRNAYERYGVRTIAREIIGMMEYCGFSSDRHDAVFAATYLILVA